jgi:hypothetical protein
MKSLEAKDLDNVTDTKALSCPDAVAAVSQCPDPGEPGGLSPLQLS